MAGDDVIRLAMDYFALVCGFTLHHRDKGIGSAAEVNHGVPMLQVVAQQLCCLVQVATFGEVPAIAAVPADAATLSGPVHSVS